MPKPLPTYVFNEHNEAYYFWQKARYDGHLNDALDIFHVDAHSDMGTLKRLSNTLYWTKKAQGDYLGHYHQIAYQGMDIANFIIPAVLNGIIKNIYFICPDWRKCKRSVRKSNVATAFGAGKVFKHNIKIKESEKAKILFAYPDLKEYSYIRTDIGRVPARRKVILDIDLDYFACTDSVTNRMSYELAITEDQYQNRNKFIEENKSLQYSGLEIEFKKYQCNYVAIVRFKKGDDRDHFPTKAEIKREVDKLVTVLKIKNIRPAVITICRSSISGYCPPQYFQMIEDYLLKQLQSCFPAINIET